jgi:hypothetical protein
MAWAGFIDFLEAKLGSDGFVKLRAQRPKWQFGNVIELRETVVEYQIIDAAWDVGLCEKSEAKALQGLLNKRNECAHPSEFYPGINEAVGYFSEILQRIETLRRKSL